MTVVLVAGPARAQNIDSSPAASDVTTASTSTFPRQGNAFSRLFGSTFSDLRQMPSSKENLFILGVAGLAAGMAHSSDGRVSTSFSGASSLRSTFSPGQVIGGATTQMVAALATQMVGNSIGNPKVAALGSDLVRAQVLTQLVTQGIKFSVRRTRPDGTQYSFPSGHTATTFATATVIQHHYGWKAGVPAYALATYVAASRVQMKRHYLSDVTMGAAIGIVGGRSVTLGRGGARFSMAPAAVPGGGAVQFNWLGRK
jgi:membrane-associated phospholipid phosphatase